MVDHNRKEHSTEFPFICQQCGHNFGRNQQYKIHVLKRHGNESGDTCYRKGSCTTCNRNFRSWKQLANHLLETGHSTTSQYFCKKCNKNIGVLEIIHHKCQGLLIIFDKQIQFKNIVSSILKEKTKTCQICSTNFETRSNMLRHRIRHSDSEKNFVCHQCGAKYYTIDSLKEHCLLTHSLEADIVYYQCDICEKKFRLKRLLKRHVQSHFANGNFNCEPCAKTYNTEAQLDRHNRNTHKLLKNTRKIDQFSFSKNGDILKVSSNESHRNEKLVSQPAPNDDQSPPTFELQPTVFAIELSDLLPVAQQSMKVLHFLETL
jgi:KRAB domain-containing zinc finger protein